MLGQVARKVLQFSHQCEQPTQLRITGIEARLLQMFGRQCLSVPTVDRSRQAIELVGSQAECAPHVAHRTPGPVSDHRRRQRRPLPPVFAVDVLDHLLAPLVLEIDVDVRRFIAFPGDKALEQHLHARRVHLGDAEAVADGGIGSRAAALAQDAAGTGEADDIVDSEKIGFVAKLGDQRQLMVHQPPHPVGRTVRPAPDHALCAEAPQPGRRSGARRHQFAGVLVTQLVQGKTAAPGQPLRFPQQFGGVETGQLPQAAQMPLAIGL